MTPASDVYSFAILMYELYTCKHLFKGMMHSQVSACTDVSPILHCAPSEPHLKLQCLCQHIWCRQHARTRLCCLLTHATRSNTFLKEIHHASCLALCIASHPLEVQSRLCSLVHAQLPFHSGMHALLPRLCGAW